MANREPSVQGLSRSQVGDHSSNARQVPIQVMVPEAIRRQVVLMGANRGENIRTIVLRGLQAIGINVPDSELGDRRGRRRNNGGPGNGAK